MGILSSFYREKKKYGQKNETRFVGLHVLNKLASKRFRHFPPQICQAVHR
jgi:hypothetical protein